MENNDNKTQVKQRGRPITVDGNYDSKRYYQTFKNKNTDKIREKVKCDICGGIYSYFNKSHHKQSKMHLKAINLVEYKTDAEKLDIEFLEINDDKIIIVD
jgi:transposase-like protein